MLFAKRDDAFSEFKQLRVAILPVEPADLIVLAIRVVVSVLSPAELVSPQKHRHTLRQKKRHQKVPALFPPQSIDLGIVGRTFRAAVPRLIVIVAVLIVLAVVLV